MNWKQQYQNTKKKKKKKIDATWKQESEPITAKDKEK